MLRFSKLRLAGFKSFVDPTELMIETGLTGVVGPNGCGKSNLVEALRWVMGETSAKQMRGGEMDDVIFGGTADRPARNIAEVALELDNAERSAPAALNDFDALEVSRRIERTKGSTYRINGREVRARDVHLLFADSATGARSAALVSQGRVGQVIAAKPTERRSLLEEAAGITGLHSRRHEAELRLHGAETNLERLDDVLATLEAQLASLKKQARQATRYRNISEHIRKAEATYYWLRWRAAVDGLEGARHRLAEAERRVGELSGVAAAATTRQAEAAAVLPELRQAEAEAAAELQRLNLAHENLGTEERRAEADAEACRVRLEQAAADLEREQALAGDAEAALARLATERDVIEAARRGEADAREQAAAAVAQVTGAVERLDLQLAELTERVATDETRRAELRRTVEDLETRRQRLQVRAVELAEQREALAPRPEDEAALSVAGTTLAAARTALEEARAAVTAAEARRAEAAEAAAARAAEAQAADTALARLQAEERALSELLEPTDADLWPPMIDAVVVEPGFEAALGAALGDDLTAPVDEAAPVRWRTLDDLAGDHSLLEGARPLADVVRGPRALSRRLSQIGIVESNTEGDRLQPALAPGQRLVSRDGGLWRWDGYAAEAGAPTTAAARLQQKNRLAEVRAARPDAEAASEAATAAAGAARAAAEHAASAARRAQENQQAFDVAFADARESEAALRQREAERESRRAALAETAQAVEADVAETETRATAASETLAALPETGEARERVAALRAELAEQRALLIERQGALDSLIREAGSRQRRLDDIIGELASWQTRFDGAGQQIRSLRGRAAELAAEGERLAALPAEIGARREGLQGEIDASAARRRAAADRLAEAESRLAEADRAARAAESALAQGREDRVRAEGAVEQGEQACRDVTERVAERLDVSPDETASLAGLDPDAPPPDLEAVERRLERLQRERDTMGPVNLRAEQEASELTEQIATLGDERGDLVEAIAKLRQGIAELNREGRQRLLASFAEVDKHFQEMFVRLFGGGRAHLALTESDDPLEAGLEIMASPPGKRLQVLSLLSGGEQALTALALLFAVFLTNPAPICVLDEVDAPLDDANVDRFCSLLEEMTMSGGTRFLVITHHRMTMARMHRLFGVTMGERGVSQLVSVDLHAAEELREIV